MHLFPLRRICLEEDALTNLEAPCGCTGTQRHAHKECIQKWVNEKHHTTCEICDQPYSGECLLQTCSLQLGCASAAGVLPHPHRHHNCS
jgi:hypothetical protein